MRVILVHSLLIRHNCWFKPTSKVYMRVYRSVLMPLETCEAYRIEPLYFNEVLHEELGFKSKYNNLRHYSKMVLIMAIEWKELILLYITINGFISYIPQIIRCIKLKSSKDVSIGSWVFWTINSMLYLIYLILDNVNIWLKLSQLLEVLIIFSTLIVVLFYRCKR